MTSKNEGSKSPQFYMQMAIEEMHRTKLETRADGKALPLVGAILVFPDGRVVKAHRGELRNGDHAEFTLIERKLFDESLEGCVLYTTLEPCASRNDPKIPCCKRVVNARIKIVYVGIEDPDPTVDGKGIRFMEEHNVVVRMFDREFQEEIEKANSRFIQQARERKVFELKRIPQITEAFFDTSGVNEFSDDALQFFVRSANLSLDPGSKNFLEYLSSLNLISWDKEQDRFLPSGNGLLLFGRNIRNKFPQSAVMISLYTSSGEERAETFDHPLVLLPNAIENWLEKYLQKSVDTSTRFARKSKYEFPIEILREVIINAIIHRDYSIEGAKSQVEIDDEKIIVKSPGAPHPSITIEQMNSFKAPTISRNPIISYVFNLVNFAEERGRGMRLFKTLLLEFDLPIPIFTFDGTNLVVTFYRSFQHLQNALTGDAFLSLKEEDIKGYQLLKISGRLKRSDYASKLNIDDKRAVRQLNRLTETNLILRRDSGKNTFYETNEAIIVPDGV